MTMSTLLAAAALVAAYQGPTYWELSDTNIVVRFVLEHVTAYLQIRLSGRQTVRDLHRTLQDVVLSQRSEINPFLTIFVVDYTPRRNFDSVADKIILASGFSVQTSVVVGFDHDGRTRIAHSNFSTDPRSWYPHRIDATLSWLSTNLEDKLDAPLHSVPIVSSSEMKHLLDWGTVPTSSQSTEHTYSPMIHHYFERAAQRTPGAVAIQWENHLLVTYADLDRNCDALASHLFQTQGVRRGDVVLLFFDKGVEMIVSLMAVLKAGAAYVPLDVDHPDERLGAIQNSCHPKVCLTTTELCSMVTSRLQKGASVKYLAVDEFLSSDQAREPCKRLNVPLTGSDLCYIMYTSGTTGVPKGVMVPHSAVVASVINGPQSNQQLRREGAKLRTLMFSNYAFDYSTWDIYLTLTSGGCLCIASKNDMLTDLTGVLNSMSITFLETTPTILALIDPAQVPTLTTVYSSGEPLTAAVRDKFHPSVHGNGHGIPQLRLGNGGAPTETTVMSAFTIIHEGDDPRTFGRPFGANRLYVLNANKELCPIGAVGQLWIGGDQVTAGYIGRPDLTEKAFQLDPFDASGGTRRMYNTGDLCSWTEDGRLLHLGRADSQVKIRGQRIETSEVECVLRDFPHVGDARVLKQSIDSNEKLVAFVVAEVRDIDVAAMMRFVSSRLPRYMVPYDIIPVASFPVTNNGKIDRPALAKLVLGSAPRRNGVAAAPGRSLGSTASEALVVATWAKVLDIPQSSIPLDRTFLESGGDSISAIRVTALYRASGTIITYNDFNEAPTVRAQAALIDARIASRGETAKHTSYVPFELLSDEKCRVEVIDAAVSYGFGIDDIEDAYPCTAYISGLISLSASNPGSYMAHYTFEKPGAFDPSHMATAWHKVLKRHAILRTAAIITPGFSNGITHIVLKGTYHLNWSFTSYLDQQSRDKAVETYLQNAPGFAWGRVPTRVALFQGPDSSVLAWQVHHSQFDGWSFPQILKDLKSAYEECVDGSVITKYYSPPPYASFVRWVNQQDPTKALDYWKSHLIDVAPRSWPRVPQEYAASIATDEIKIQLWTRGRDVAKFCAARQLTMSSLVRTALAVVLSIQESTDDVLFGVITSGRNGDLVGIEDIVGSCIAAFPCRIRVPSHFTLEQVLKSVHEQSVASTPYQSVGLSDIIQAHPGGANLRSLFDILLVIENLPGLNDADHTFVGRNLRGHRLEMNYPLTITVFPTSDKSELQFQFQWDSRCLSSADIRWFSSHLFAVLDTIMASPAQEVRHVSILSEEEVDFVRSVGLGTPPRDHPTLSTHKFFHTLVDEIAAHNPSSIAVECLRGVSVTYGALVARANQAAHGLVLRGVGPEVLVPIIFDKFQSEVDTVISLLAIMKSGGAFVPLDASWPADRLASCIGQMRSKFLICDSLIPEVAKALNISLVTLEELSRGHDISAPLTTGLRSSSLSYVMYTSGSTGSPKGVMLDHFNVIAFMANASTIFPLETAHRFLHFSPWSFDVGLADMFLAFSRGATLVLADMNQMLSDLSGVLNSLRVDYAVLTPPVAQLLKQDVDHPYLRSLIVTGERLPRQLSNQWRDKVVFLDAYGPTEVTVQCIGVNHSTAVPAPGVIGRPFGMTQAYILDDSMNVSPVGVIGELCLAGDQVGRGYFEMPEETSHVFVHDPFVHGRRMYRSGDLARWTSDGFIEYLGRKDGGFVKLHGVRIDVSEVEATLMLTKKTFAVVELVELDGQSHLLAFLSRELAPTGASQIHLISDPVASRRWIEELISACKLTVPSYAIPSLWLVLEAMPQANSNKIDRKQLRQFFRGLSSEQDLVQSITRDLLNVAPPRPPQDAFEQMLLDLWTQILETDDISVQDDFFTLGGNSIKSIIFLSKVHRYGWMITLEEFRHARTIVRLAEIVKAMASSSSRTIEGTLSGGLVVQIQTARSAEEKARSPIWFIHDGAGFIGPDYWLIDHLGREVYGISNPSTDQSGLENNYPTFESFSTQYLPLIPSDQDVYIAGWSSGGNIALDVATKRRARGMPVKGVILLDTFNTEGWKLLNAALNPGYERGELQIIHVKHTTLLMQQVVETYCDFPVLLIQAGSEHPLAIPDVWEYPPLPITEKIDSRHKRNFYTSQNLPFMEIIRVEEANHFSLLLESPYRKNVADIIRHWCK